jgi:3-oxoacyl-[acyl-carrier protein] reductase
MTSEHGTVLLTGGAGAIGRMLARDLFEAGYGVIVLDRDRAALTELNRACPEVITYACDLAAFAEVSATIDDLHADGHRVDVLVNNAGTIHSEPLLNPLKRPDPRHDVDAWHRTIESNLHSVFYMTACVAARMVECRTRGVIVNISSIAAAGNAGQSAYGAAKAAVNALTKTWSRELAPFGIRVAAIAPGFIDVASTRKALTDKHIDQWVRQTPSGRLGRPEEMTQAVRFIIENGYFNGRILELDGGLRI